MATPLTRRLKSTISRSYVKSGFALPTSRERDDESNLSGLENYTIGHSSDVEQLYNTFPGYAVI